MPVVLFCKACWTGYGSAGDVPQVCPACLCPTTWTVFYDPPTSYPKRKWALSGDDQDFLRVNRIRPE